MVDVWEDFPLKKMWFSTISFPQCSEVGSLANLRQFFIPDEKDLDKAREVKMESFSGWDSGILFKGWQWDFRKGSLTERMEESWKEIKESHRRYASKSSILRTVAATALGLRGAVVQTEDGGRTWRLVYSRSIIPGFQG
jgi:hypothetical protein